MNISNIAAFMVPIKCSQCGELDLKNTLKKIASKYGDRWICKDCAPSTPAPGADVRSLMEIKMLRSPRFASVLGDDVALLDQPGGLALVKKKYCL